MSNTKDKGFSQTEGGVLLGILSEPTAHDQPLPPPERYYATPELARLAKEEHDRGGVQIVPNSTIKLEQSSISFISKLSGKATLDNMNGKITFSK